MFSHYLVEFRDNPYRTTVHTSKARLPSAALKLSAFQEAFRSAVNASAHTKTDKVHIFSSSVGSRVYETIPPVLKSQMLFR